MRSEVSLKGLDRCVGARWDPRTGDKQEKVEEGTAVVTSRAVISVSS